MARYERIKWQHGQRYVDGTCPTCNYWPCVVTCPDRRAELEARVKELEDKE